MSKRGLGGLFCLIAALLAASHYLAGAIYGSLLNWENTAGTALITFSVIALGIGVIYIIWAEYADYKTDSHNKC